MKTLLLWIVLLGLLQATLVVLKIVNVITWSWLTVLLPLGLIALIIAFVFFVLSAWKP